MPFLHPCQPPLPALAGASLLTQSADRAQVQAHTNFQGLSRCLCSFLLTLSHGFFILACCSNLCNSGNSALIPTEIFSPLLFLVSCSTLSFSVTCRDNPSVLSEAEGSDLLQFTYVTLSLYWCWCSQVLHRSLSLSGSSPCWWSLCSLQVWLLKLLLTHFPCWYRMGWEHHLHHTWAPLYPHGVILAAEFYVEIT